MLPAGLPVCHQPPLLDGLDHLRDLGRGQYLGGFSFDMADQPAVHHVVRHEGLEGAVANEVDDGVELMIRHPQQGFEGHHVQMVLVQGILEAVLAAIDLLGPVLLGRIAEYPALHVLGLNHE